MMKALVMAGIVLVISSTTTSAWGDSRNSAAQRTKAPAMVAQSYGTWGWQEVSYKKDISPIFQQNCAACHTPGGVGYAQSGFSVKNYRAVMKGSKYGPVIVPGSSISSNLVWLLEHGADPTMAMPRMYQVIAQRHSKYVIPSMQARALSAHDIWLISVWVDQGAKNN